MNITIDRSNGSVPGLFSISGEERPNYVSGVSLTPAGGSTPTDWINAAAFSTPASQTFGNLGRNAFRAPGISQLDLGLSKYVSITERVSIRLRADVFNVFNRAQFGAPNADLSQRQLRSHHNYDQQLCDRPRNAARAAIVRQNHLLDSRTAGAAFDACAVVEANQNECRLKAQQVSKCLGHGFLFLDRGEYEVGTRSQPLQPLAHDLLRLLSGCSPLAGSA